MERTEHLLDATVLPSAAQLGLSGAHVSNYTSPLPASVSAPPVAATTPSTVSLEVMNALVWVIIVLCFLSSTANAYILTLSRWIRGVYGTVLRLTFGLAAADCWTSLIMGISFTFYTMPTTLKAVSYGDCILLFLELFRMGSVFTSILHLLMMAVNHYQSIGVQQAAKINLSGRLLTVLMLLSWIVPPLIFFVTFWAVPNDGFITLLDKNETRPCRHDFMKSIEYRSIIYISLLTPVLVMIGLYLCMMQALNALDKQFQRQNRRSRSVKLKQKMLLTIVLMIGSFLMGWVPSGTWLLLTARESRLAPAIKGSQPLLFALSYLVNLLMVLKFLANPVIYGLRIPEINEVFRQPFSKKRHSVIASALHSHASKATRTTPVTTRKRCPGSVETRVEDNHKTSSHASQKSELISNHDLMDDDITCIDTSYV